MTRVDCHTTNLNLGLKKRGRVHRLAGGFGEADRVGVYLHGHVAVQPYHNGGVHGHALGVLVALEICMGGGEVGC